MNNKKEIRRLRGLGLTIRQIQRKLNISSPSVVQYHLKHVSRFEGLIFPERHPKHNDRASEYMCAGFNEYRRLLIEKLEEIERGE
jgi:hypothetical protein